jgi:hypothetical protein
LLLNYGQSLTQLKYQRSELNLIKSGNALGRFFAATGVIVLISIVGFLLFGLLVVLLAATGAEGFQSST